MAVLKRRGWITSIAVAAMVTAAGLFRAAIPSAQAAAPIASKEAVYAAFTINLTRFISWPDAAFSARQAPFLIGTYPRDPVNDELDAAAKGEAINGHPVQTVRLHSLDDVAKCHVVFVSRGVADPSMVVARVQHRPVLTISDAEGFLNLGGHVRFVPQPGRTGLQVSAKNLRASGLEARAQLLRIASAP